MTGATVEPIPRRLHWGCGPVVAEGWVNSDREDYHQQHLGDLRDGLPFDTGEFDYVVSNHALQMLTYTEVVPALIELRRVTSALGWVRILVPDAVRAFRAWQAGRAMHFLVADDPEPTIDGKLCAYLSWYSTARLQFTGPWLCELLGRAGWGQAQQVAWGTTASDLEAITELDSREHESVVVEARA